MLLKDLLKNIYTKPLPPGGEELMIESISCDSRIKQPQGLFVALEGFKVKGEDFIREAIDQGAVAVAKKGSNRRIGNYTIPDGVVVLDVSNPPLFLHQVALRFFDYPSRRVRTIGVTGTNGKTTITYLLESIFKANRQPCAVIGTVNYRIAGKIFPSKNTTPGFLENQSHLAQLASLKIPYCVMEVSSHALEQGRVEGIDYVSAIFTNLTQDHLDYHKNMESYFKAKSILFKNLNDYAAAIINEDDMYGQPMMRLSKGQVVTYGMKASAQVRAQQIESSLNGTHLDVVFPSGKISMTTPFIGQHNVYNILAACACAWKEGVGFDQIRQGIETLSGVPGRMEAVEAGQDYFVFIDYAHTEDGLVNVLQALRAVSRSKIILVFGCGGDRDRGKRPKMGAVACQGADYSIVTSDNPRNEDPAAIIAEITRGFTKNNYEVIVDRQQAIAHALEIAQPGQIVLIAGKGHEDYQIFRDRTIEFDERKIVQELIKRQ